MNVIRSKLKKLLWDFDRKDIIMIINLLKMNLKDRYLGSLLGLAWAIVNPLFYLGLYAFVFGFVFKSRAPGADTTFSFAIWLISGYVPYLCISECFSNAAVSIVGCGSIVKNLSIKTECIPIAYSLVSLVPFTIGMIFLFILLIIDRNYPTWHALLILPILLLQMTFLAGIGFFLSATTVFIRDITQAIGNFLMLIVFFSPIFYPLEALPKMIQKISFFNPFYQITQPYRDVLIYHHLPHLKGVLYLALVSIFLFHFGLIYFRRLKGYFTMAL